MKKLSIFLSFFFLIGTSLVGNENPVFVMKKEGENKIATLMYQTVDGPVKLFYEPADVIVFEDRSTTITTLEANLFYIGTSNEVEQINSGNYKRMVKKYLPNAHELHKRLGKRGFRFENLPSMILYYNKNILEKNQPITKTEIEKLLVN